MRGALKAIELTQEEYEAIKRQAERIYEHKNRISTREQRRKEEEYASIKAFISKLQGPGIPQTAFRRREYRTMEKLVNMTINILSQSIIPGYEDKVIKAKEDVDMRNRYTEYLNKSKNNLDIYNKMRDKLEGVL